MVVKDTRNADWVKVICRDETEIQLIKEATHETIVPEVRGLRSALELLMKVNNANKIAVLDFDKKYPQPRG